MQKIYFILGVVFLTVGNLAAQITNDPTVSRKSQSDTYINKIEITDNQTIVSMKYVSKTAQEMIDELIRTNPEAEKELRRMDDATRRKAIQQYIDKNENTIAFQSSSYLLTRDRKKYKFLRASNIPVSPQKLKTEPGKSYYFTVYFEKLPPGYESVDIVESEVANDGNLSYWNFFGVEVNNPGVSGSRPSPTPSEPNKVPSVGGVRISLTGRVLDATNDKPIAAKIVCIARRSNRVYDSLYTSRSGNYEFVIAPDNYLYEISAEGYETREEDFDLSQFKTSRTITRDFYLNLAKMTNGVPPSGVPPSGVPPNRVPPVVENKTEPAQETIPGRAPDIVVVNPKPKQEQKAEPAPTEEAKPAPLELPKKPAPVVVNENTFRLDKVYFKVGEAVILPNSYDQLEGVAEMMKEKPEMRIQLEGHTDNQGDSKLNQKLSLERAFKVREYLMTNGIDGKRIGFTGYGDTRPIAPNNNEENRRKNRRVEFKIL